MNHKTKAIALAVGTAVAVGAGGAVQAQSSITLQGLIDANVQSIDQSGAGYAVADRASRRAVDPNGMTTSWWGVGGTESLGGDLRAVFALQGFFRPDTGEGGRFGGTDVLFKRAAWVGLESTGLGRVTLGRQSTQYFLSTVQTNPFGDSFGFGPSILHTFGTVLGSGLGLRFARDRYVLNDSGWSNAVQYSTPSFAGLTAAAMFSKASGSNDQEDGTARGRSWSGQLAYRSGPIVAIGVYQGVRVNATDQQQKAWLLGGAYDLKVVRLFAQYQSIDTTILTSGDDDSTWTLGATVPIGKHNILGSYASTTTEDKSGLLADEERKTFAIGYRYDFSRRTDG